MSGQTISENNTRAHAEMQNIQRRANEERQLCNAISQDLAKAPTLW